MTWLDWLERHAVVFAFSGDADLAMLREWAKLFHSAGYTPEQANEATSWLALDGPPVKYRTDQLTALRTRLQGQRARQAACVEPAPAESSCALCHGPGVVSGLPAPATWDRGPRCYQMAYCRCPLGRWMASNRQGYCDANGNQMQTLDQYEAGNPYWRDQLARLRAEREAEAAARGRAADNDRTFGPLLARIRRERGS